MVSKQDFFKVKTAPQMLKQQTKTIKKNILDEILNINNEEIIIIENDLIKSEERGKKFAKFGHTINLRRFQSYKETMGLDAKTIRDEAIDEEIKKRNKKAISGITYKPFAGPNNLTKKFTLTELLKASKIYGYAPWNPKEELFKPTIHVKPYDEPLRVSRDGAEIIVRVPSRNKKPKYEMRFFSTPTRNNAYALNLAMLMTTSHMCKQKEFFIRYTWEFSKERSNIYIWDSHEIAGYFAIVDFYLNPKRRGLKEKKNTTPYNMNLFGHPTHELMKFYDALEHNTLIKGKEDKKPRRLLDIEKEVLLWNSIIHEFGYDALNSKQKIKEYEWKKT